MPPSSFRRTWNTIRVGFFLANRQMLANKGTSILIVVVMILTYLNLLMVSGLLVGIVDGLRQERRDHYTGDIMIVQHDRKNAILNSPDTISYLKTLPLITSFSPRYKTTGIIEGNYAEKITEQDTPDVIISTFIGIDPTAEDATTGLSHLIVEGEYLRPTDYNQILIGTSLLARYKTLTALPGTIPIPKVGVGDKVRIMLNGIEREMTVKGIVASKLEEINLSAYMVDAQLRAMLGRTNRGVNEIAVRVAPGASAPTIRDQLKRSPIGNNGLILYGRDSEPSFFQDFASTFGQLGTILGSTGLVISFIAVFILVFINTVTHRRSIGILQAIGVRPGGIEIGYVAQSSLFSSLGAVIGIALNFMLIEPYFVAHPIDFPFSNGILSVSITEAWVKALVLYIAIMCASIVPARMIMRQEIVDAILGR